MKIIINFFKNSLLISSIASTKIRTIEDWCKVNSTITTPDQMLAAAVIQNMAKHFDEWKWYNLDSKIFSFGDKPHRLATIFRKDPDLKFTFGWSRQPCGNLSHRIEYVPCAEKKPTINDIPIDERDAREVFHHFNKLRLAFEELKTTTARAKQELEENEAKWNLVEKLLKMRRNEHGALVPIQPEIKQQVPNMMETTMLSTSAIVWSHTASTA